MEALARSFTFISNEAIVKIPFFQRGYVWRKDNWSDLLSDLNDLNKNHFLGSIILKQQPSRAGDPKEVLVIDGQQRLTTISILIKALYDSFSDETKESAKDVIRQHLFYKRNRTDRNYSIKIQHSHVDAKSFNYVIKFGLDSSEPVPFDEKDRILSCYHFYTTTFSSLTDEWKETLFNYILDPDNKIIVVIDLHQDDDEQAIFDTINSAGVRLSPADIVKNSLFQAAIRFVGSEEAVALYNDTWDEVFVKNNLKFWETQRATGRLLRDNLEILLHAISVIKNFYDPEVDTLSDLSKLYKKKIDGFKTHEELKSFIYEIKEYGQLYKDKILAFTPATLFSFKNTEQRLFHILNTLDISTFHPFVLYLYKQHSGDVSQLNSLLEQLSSFVVRRIIANWETKSFNKLSKELINNPSLLAEKLSEIPEEDFISGLKYISNKHAALLLFWIELQRRHIDRKYGQDELKYAYTLEHVMPQKWKEYWSEIPEKVNTGGVEMSRTDAEADRSDKIYWIGNMTLLTSSLNTSLRNYEFKRKMEGEGRKKGMKAYAELSITSHDLVDAYDKGDQTWDESDIEIRTNNLVKEAFSIWKC